MNDLAAYVELEHKIVRWSSQNVNSLAFIYNTAQNKTKWLLTNRKWDSSRRITSIVQLVTGIGQKSIQLRGVRKNGCIISNDQERRNSQI